MLKNRQHYVWQYYLKSWGNDEKVFCRIDNKVFRTNTVNLAIENRFYELKEISDKDIQTLRHIFNSNHSDQPVEHILIELFDKVFQLMKAIPDFESQPDEIKNLFKKFIVNANEDLHARIENIGYDYLYALIEGNELDLSHPDRLYNFILFIVYQYSRTKKIYERGKVETEESDVDFESIWPVLTHLVSYRVSLNLYDRWGSYSIIKLHNNTQKYLITGDQPVINLCSGNVNEAAGNFELYYPIKPKLAIWITTNKVDSQEIDLSLSDVKRFNQLIYEESFHQVYAVHKEDFSELF